MRKPEPFHKLRCRERFIAERSKEPLDRCFILIGDLVGSLVAFSVGVAANDRNLYQGCPG